MARAYMKCSTLLISMLFACSDGACTTSVFKLCFAARPAMQDALLESCATVSLKVVPKAAQTSIYHQVQCMPCSLQAMPSQALQSNNKRADHTCSESGPSSQLYATLLCSPGQNQLHLKPAITCLYVCCIGNVHNLSGLRAIQT
ncbi:unnamed protein product [Effrenium voratum]|uniref:Secreted protein n=1 Tax=Effrenium voratum TaxID=2562239 RepID=A0AA36JDR0_9DINO|nr:unnamed protein product [Effrenium voratum]